MVPGTMYPSMDMSGVPELAADGALTTMATGRCALHLAGLGFPMSPGDGRLTTMVPGYPHPLAGHGFPALAINAGARLR